MINLPDNKLSLFWYGVNVSNFLGQNISLDFKEYYQFESALFLDTESSIEKQQCDNDSIIEQIEAVEGIDLQELKGNPKCRFLSVVKKPTPDSKNRQGYTFRVCNAFCGKDLEFAKKVMQDKFKIPTSLVCPLFTSADQISLKGNYKTYPISGIGFCKKDITHSYIQVYITNNTDTTEGKINLLDFDNVIDHTNTLLNGYGLRSENVYLYDLTKIMYEFGMFLALYGFDISEDGIDKAKLYFRATNYIDFDSLILTLKKYLTKCNQCATIPLLQSIVKDIGKKKFIDFLAISFKEIDGEIKLHGLQFYFEPCTEDYIR